MRQTRLSHRSGKGDEETATRASTREAPSYFGDMMSLQSTMGNAAVGNLVRSRERATQEAPTPIDAYTQSLIAKQSGGPEVVTSQAGARIHHGPESDMLTRMLGATGLTQGNDVFLRSDRHPASEAGRATLAHELTHVARGSIGPGAVMREPDTQVGDPMDSSKGATPHVVAKIVLGGDEMRGGSKVAGHEGEVEFDSVSLGGSHNPGSSSGKQDDPRGIEIGCMRHLDDLSAEWMKAFSQGTPIKSARFTFLKTGGDGTTQDALSLEFTDGLVSGYQPSGEYESVAFNFKARS